MLENIFEISLKNDSLERFLYDVLPLFATAASSSDKENINFGIGFLIGGSSYETYIYNGKEVVKSNLPCKNIIVWNKKFFWNNRIVVISNKPIIVTPEIYLLVAVANKLRTNQLLRSILLRDSITNLYTHKVGYELLKGKNTKNSVLLLFDIDDFKKINDSFGHLYGDKILLEVGSFLIDAFRKEDLIVRWGGEEFLVFLENFPEDLEFFKLFLAKLKNEEKKTLYKTAKVSLSIGAYYIFEETNEIEKLINKTDALLYLAKGYLEQEVIYKYFTREAILNNEKIKNNPKDRIVGLFSDKLFIISSNIK